MRIENILTKREDLKVKRREVISQLDDSPKREQYKNSILEKDAQKDMLETYKKQETDKR